MPTFRSTARPFRCNRPVCPVSDSPSALPSGYRLRHAAPADAALLPAVERAAAQLFRGTGLIDPDDPSQAAGHPLALLEARAQDGLLWLVDGPAGPVAFALAEMHQGRLHLEELSVHPAHGRRGLGRALVRRVCHEARTRQALPLSLSTFRDIPWNAPFYARLGFKEIPETALTTWQREIRRREGAFLDIRQRCMMAWDAPP